MHGCVCGEEHGEHPYFCVCYVSTSEDELLFLAMTSQ